MNDINLLESIDKNSYRDKRFGSGISIAIPIVVLAGIFSILIGAKLFLAYLENKNTTIMKENEQALSELNGKNVDRIVNFDTRMEMGLKEISAKENYDSYLKELESLMVSGARVDTLKYYPGGIELAIVADNYNTVARQILSFKNSSNFKGLTIGKTSGNEAGNILFTMKK